jgi:hypothetical protein
MQRGRDAGALRLLRLLCALESAPEAAAPLAAGLAGEAGAARWPALEELLGAHGLAPWAFTALRGAGLAGTAPGGLREAWRGAVLRNRAHLAEIGRIAAGLGDAGVAVLPLKGASLLGRVYPDPGQRPMQDLDLLVRPEAVAAAGEVLLALGYRRPEPPGAAAQAGHFHAMYALPGRGLVVELHWSLSDAGLIDPARVGAVWERAVPVAAGRELRLDGATEIAFVALHASKHGVLNALLARRPLLRDAALDPLSGNRLLWFLDLRRLMAAGGTTLAAAAGRAEEWDAAAALHAGVVLAQELFGAVPGWEWHGPPPPHGMSAPRALVSSWLASGLARGRPGTARVLERLMRMDPSLHARPVRALELLDGLRPSPAQVRNWRARRGAATLPVLWGLTLARGTAAGLRAGAALLKVKRARREAGRRHGGRGGERS